MRLNLRYCVGSNVVLPSHIVVPPLTIVTVRIHFAEGVGFEVSRTKTLVSWSPGVTVNPAVNNGITYDWKMKRLMDLTII
jgi:hypothetical protein